MKKLKLSSLSSGYFPLIVVFFLLVSVKILLSFYFKSPWLFADETVYAETARNILHGEFYSKLLYAQVYPPGYSLFLSVAYLISGNSFASYHFMLIINALITSSIIFPAYFILKKYCPNEFSIIGSVFVAILPSVVLYNFVVMSENLFIPLFTFSLWFLIESFETNSKKWGILAGFSIFLLYFTRILGIAMIIGFFFALTYNILKQSKSKKIATILKENHYPVTAFCISTILWIFYKSYLGLATVSGYDNNVYLSSIVNAVSNIQSFAQFLSLTLHELEFLILSSYFIFFVLALYWIYEIFWNDAYDNNTKTGVIHTGENLSTKSGIIYVLVSSIILIILTVTHMFAAVALQNDRTYLILGRYIDSIVPVIILAGIIGFNSVLKMKNSERKKCILVFISINLLLLILFLADFPTKNYKFPNIFSIFYIQGIPNLIPIHIFLILFIGITLMVFIIALYHKRLWYLIFLLLVVFSILSMNYTIQVQIERSSFSAENFPIVEYLVNHSNESSRILMSNDDYNYYTSYGSTTWYSTQFFIPGYLIRNTTEHVSSGTGDLKNQQIDYTISQKILPNNILAVSKTGFKLYGSADRKKSAIILPYTINVRSDSGGRIENFYPTDTWTKNYSKILVEYPKNFGEINLTVYITGDRPRDNPAHVVFKINDQELRNITYTGNRKTVSVIVPDKYLNDYFQIFEINTNTWRMSDYGPSSDSRDLGVRIEKITIQNNSKKI